MHGVAGPYRADKLHRLRYEMVPGPGELLAIAAEMVLAVKNTCAMRPLNGVVFANRGSQYLFIRYT